MMTIPTEYHAEHLFVLVGKNPLPNLVAIDALRPKGGHVYLICTTETASFAEKIISAAKLTSEHAIVIPVNDEQGLQMIERVQSYAVNKVSLGLNYTGGTKHMVLHAFQGIQQAAQAMGVKPVLSYLDARTLEMRVEYLGSASCGYAVTSVDDLGFDTLLAMHGYSIKSYAKEPILPDIYASLARLQPKELSGWYQKARQGKDKEKQKGIPLPDIPSLQPYWKGAKTVGELAQKLGISMSEMGDWFAGHWLEHYSLAAIQEIAPKCGIADDASVMNLKAADFEFDVAALKGYQLFAMSCNTQADKGTIKQKLFEAYIRAHQMGGDEARVAVVCFAPKDGKSEPERIEEEIVREWDAKAKGKVRVFGEEHLPNLPKHLKHWISIQN